MSIAHEADKVRHTTRPLTEKFMPCRSNGKDKAETDYADIQDLPPELIEKVLRCVGPDDLLAFSQVSKYTRRCSAGALKRACDAKGLALPDSGVSNWSSLFALSRGTARRLRDGALEGGPSWTHHCRNKPSDDHVFPCGAFQHVGVDGIYIEGVERLRVELPSMGSDVGIKVRYMDHRENRFERSDYALLATSDGHVVYDTDIQVFVNSNDTSAYAKVTPPKPVYCAAASDHTLATGHEDCVRLWSLPGLAFKGELNAKSICRLRWSPGGDYLVGADMFGHSLMKMWKLPDSEPIWSMEGETFEFDSKQGELAFIVRFHDGMPLDDQLVILSPFSLTTRARQISSFYTATVNAMPGKHVGVDVDGTIYLVSSDLSEPDIVVAEKRLFVDHDLGGITMSSDGRWVVGLLSKGDLLFWDLSAPQFF